MRISDWSSDVCSSDLPSVAAARARVDAARADRDMLAKGSHEIAVAGRYVRRSVDREGGYDEFDATSSRPFRLPGKAALDREAGALGMEVAENRMEDARHQAALLLSGYWKDWLVDGGLYRNDLVTVGWLAKALSALRRRVALSSEESRVGHKWVRSGSSRGAPYN